MKYEDPRKYQQQKITFLLKFSYFRLIEASFLHYLYLLSILRETKAFDFGKLSMTRMSSMATFPTVVWTDFKITKK